MVFTIKYMTKNECWLATVEKTGTLPRTPQSQATDQQHLKIRKQHIRIGTWNVRTLHQSGKLENLILEAEALNVDILGITETRWKDAGYTRKENFSFIHSGGDYHERGVGILIKKETEKYISG